MPARKRGRSDSTGETASTPETAPAGAKSSSYAPLLLSVGGTHFTTTRATLCAEKGSMMATKFDAESPFGANVVDEQGALFLDADPATFSWILGYLRRGCRLVGTPPQPLLEQVRADADYFGLAGLVDALDEKLRLIRKEERPTFIYDHLLIGPTDIGDGDPEDNDVEKQREYERSVKRINDYGRRGFRIVHAASDAEGTYVDCILEKKE